MKSWSEMSKFEHFNHFHKPGINLTDRLFKCWCGEVGIGFNPKYPLISFLTVAILDLAPLALNITDLNTLKLFHSIPVIVSGFIIYKLMKTYPYKELVMSIDTFDTHIFSNEKERDKAKKTLRNDIFAMLFIPIIGIIQTASIIIPLLLR